MPLTANPAAQATALDAFRRLVFTAVVAGLAAGAVAAVAHQLATAPLIARAEIYETPAPAIGHAPAGHTHGAPAEATAGSDHASVAATEWEPAPGLERALYTAMADLVTGVAYALLLVAAFELRGQAVGWRQGLFWGLAGFVAFALAPRLGLPPQLPATPAAPLLDRQLWWAGTAALTAGGLALILLQRRPGWAVAGCLLLAAPHVYGAPVPTETETAVPAALVEAFAAASTVTNLLFWTVLGGLSGALAARWNRPRAVSAAGGHLALDQAAAR